MSPVFEQPTLTGHHKRLAAVRHQLSGARMFSALRALDFAQRYHVNVRKDGVTPEFAHQTSIASYILTLAPHLLDVEGTLATAWLHDLVEDYDVGLVEISNLFGVPVGASVHAMSKVIAGVRRPVQEVVEEQGNDPRASIVKGADRINNQQTMPGVFTLPKIEAYIAETREQILPMLKFARRRFPEQTQAYENSKLILVSQIELLEAALAGVLAPDRGPV
jgi:(p)ppGpp synthase/HD superfamily hydrolase